MELTTQLFAQVVSGLIGAFIPALWFAYKIGHLKGYKKGLDYGSAALKDYSEHVSRGIRSMRS